MTKGEAKISKITTNYLSTEKAKEGTARGHAPAHEFTGVGVVGLRNMQLYTSV